MSSDAFTTCSGPGEATAADIGDELPEPGHALGLHLLLQLVELAVLLRVPGVGRRVVAEDVLGEQELDVPAAASADGGGEQGGPPADLGQELGGNDLHLHRVGPRVL